jgi:hypothetical protein
MWVIGILSLCISVAILPRCLVVAREDFLPCYDKSFTAIRPVAPALTIIALYLLTRQIVRLGA